ncbi:hypothetical protein GOODEAATRI_022799 [Goodea atripinnis]|uniref:Uncharacterized protein n=1 Tax=Goodea atripinnis TaxID=208336 RepID=A0ABV0ML40_9TELE
MYISLMPLIKAEEIIPRLMRKPPIMTTGRQPKRLLSIEARGAEGGSYVLPVFAALYRLQPVYSNAGTRVPGFMNAQLFTARTRLPYTCIFNVPSLSLSSRLL